MSERAAIVGTGYVARVHAHALRELGVRVVAVCGRSTTGELADELDATAYDDLGRLLDTERPDVLHVCTPNAAHAEQTLLAIEHGIHVVCEKPLAVSSTEAVELAKAASLAGLVAACCYHCRGYPLVRRMREEVESGALGEIRAVHGRYACDDVFLMPTGWRYEPAAAGPSYVVGDLGTHWLDLAEHVTGLPVAEVFAEFVGEPLEHYAALLLRFEGGAVGSLVLTAGAAGRKNQLLFECEGLAGRPHVGPGGAEHAARTRRHRAVTHPDQGRRSARPLSGRPRRRLRRRVPQHLRRGLQGDPRRAARAVPDLRRRRSRGRRRRSRRQERARTTMDRSRLARRITSGSTNAAAISVTEAASSSDASAFTSGVIPNLTCV